MLAIESRLPIKGDRMRSLLAFLPLALGLSGCIDSRVDLSASLPAAFPIKEGFYKAANDPNSPAFKVVRVGSDYRAIDPKEPDGKGAVFTLMDPDHTGLFIAEDKTGASDVNPPLYAYYFVAVDASGDRVDLYDFTKRDWRRLPADLKKRFVAGLSLRLVEDADTAAALRELDRQLAIRPTPEKTTFRFVRPLDGASN
jgi:hypothetical protein